jgi:hypothetical protein
MESARRPQLPPTNAIVDEERPSPRLIAPFRISAAPRRWPPISQLACANTASAEPLVATCAFMSCWLTTRVAGPAPNFIR